MYNLAQSLFSFGQISLIDSIYNIKFRESLNEQVAFQSNANHPLAESMG